MALSRLCLSFAVIAIFFCSLTLIPPKSGGIKASSSNTEEELRKNMVLGSRPPACVNKCMSCKPCVATLVIPAHRSGSRRAADGGYQESSSHREDDSYYLLSWKCRCGNRLYQP